MRSRRVLIGGGGDGSDGSPNCVAAAGLGAAAGDEDCRTHRLVGVVPASHTQTMASL